MWPRDRTPSCADAIAVLISFATKRRPVDGGCLLLNGADIVDVLAPRVGHGIFKADLATGLTRGTRKDPPRVFDQFAHLILRVELFSYADDLIFLTCGC